MTRSITWSNDEGASAVFGAGSCVTVAGALAGSGDAGVASCANEAIARPVTTRKDHETDLRLRIDPFMNLERQASWKMMCTTAVESAGWPSRIAGLKLICSAARTADSSRP